MKYNLTKKIFIVTLSVIILSLIPQHSKSQSFGKNEQAFLFMDIVSGGLMGGTGAIFNKKENQTRGNAFLHGFIKGCIGGSVVFTGKYLVYQIKDKESYAMAWPAKIIHSAGASIIENAAKNKVIYDNWALDIGPGRIDVNYKGKISPRLQLFALGGMALTFIQGSKFDFIKTIQMGTPYFYNYDMKNHLTAGNTNINSMSINKATFEYNKKNNTFDKHPDTPFNVSGHELIHCFQYREYLSINYSYFKNNQKFIYIDAPAFLPAYLLSPEPFEEQAEFLSKHRRFE